MTDINNLFSLPRYHMATVNLLMLAAVGGGFWALRKRHLSSLVWVVVLSVLPIVSFFRPGDYNGGLQQNASYAMAFDNSLREGHLIPRWGEYLDTYFGSPAFVFMYPLPFYLTSVIHGIGFNTINSLKLVLAGTYLLAGVGMWRWMREKFTDWGAGVAAVFYQFAPYRLVDLHMRLDLGEGVAFVFLPWLFLSMEKLRAGAGRKWLAVGAAATAGLILSHQAISLAGVLLAGGYALAKASDRKKFIKGLAPLILGVLMAAYYWLPLFQEIKYTHTDLHTNTVEFLQFRDLLFSRWRWGLLLLGPGGELSHMLGYMQWTGVGLAIGLVALGRVKKTEIMKKGGLVFWLAVFVLVIILMLEPATRLWRAVPGFNKFQFSWRLLGIEAMVGAIISGYAVDNFSGGRKIIIGGVMVAGAVAATILNWGNRETSPRQITDREILDRLPLSPGASFPQGIPVWVNPMKMAGEKKVTPGIVVLSGQADITNLGRTSTERRYLIKAASPVRLRENTNYFPGWRLLVNNISQPIEYRDPKNAGIMIFALGPGIYKVEFKFLNTASRNLGLGISGIAVGALLFKMNSRGA